MTIKLDLHTHSEASPDGGINLNQYKTALQNGTLDIIAITDHNRIDFATHAFSELGDNIIVGEEIMTTEGEIIGIYLKKHVSAGLSPQKTIEAIKDQGGIVYIPHPFETVRKGLHPATLESIMNDIDIIEGCNGRAFLQDRSQQTLLWAKLNHVPIAASSDAHSLSGLGRTYLELSEQPTRTNLVRLVASGKLNTRRPNMLGLLAPKYNKTRNKLLKRT
jgi:predicted metal-dependent phosphoesterase TrpH